MLTCPCGTPPREVGAVSTPESRRTRGLETARYTTPHLSELKSMPHFSGKCAGTSSAERPWSNYRTDGVQSGNSDLGYKTMHHLVAGITRDAAPGRNSATAFSASASALCAPLRLMNSRMKLCPARWCSLARASHTSP